MQESFCRLCGDRGVIVTGDAAYPCRCLPMRRLEKKFRDARIPPVLTRCTFETFDFRYYSRECRDEIKGISYYASARIAYRAAQDFVGKVLQKRPPEGLLFTGQVGSGKTFLACCIANALLQKGEVLLFAVVPDLLDQIRYSFDLPRQAGAEFTEKDLTGMAREVPVLVLDDLGAHNYTEWTRNKIYGIINYRLNYSLPTVITTNLNLEELGEALGKRTTSRILQMCRPYRLLVECDIRIVQRQKDLTD
ncbi:MAG: ATP-binding protein [Firmicutes bacterium]|nr:ATP-binding protein [Bacillota bacterium]